MDFLFFAVDFFLPKTFSSGTLATLQCFGHIWFNKNEVCSLARSLFVFKNQRTWSNFCRN